MEGFNCVQNPFDLLDADGDDEKILSVPAAPVVTAPWLMPSQKGKASRKEEEKKRAAEAEKKKKKAAEKSKKVEEEMKKKREELRKKKETEEKAMTLAEYEKKKADMEALRKTEQRKVDSKDFASMKVVVGSKKEEVVFGLSQPKSEKQKLKKKVIEKNDKMTAEEFQKKYGTVNAQVPNASSNGASSSGSGQSPAEENTPNVADTAEFPGLSTAATSKGRSRSRRA